MNLLLIAFSLAGIYVAVYFSLVFYGVPSAATAIVPSFCQPENGVCQSIVHHRDGQIFGIPNSVLGSAYYVIVLMTVSLHLAWLMPALVVVSWFVVAVGVYLSYSLLSKIKVVCFLCIASHVLNFLIAVVLTLQVTFQ